MLPTTKKLYTELFTVAHLLKQQWILQQSEMIEFCCNFVNPAVNDSPSTILLHLHGKNVVLLVLFFFSFDSRLVMIKCFGKNPLYWDTRLTIKKTPVSCTLII